MKARLHPTPAMQKAIDAYAESKIQGIQSRAQEAVMKERNDIATRATYLCLLACYQRRRDAGVLKKVKKPAAHPCLKKTIKPIEQCVREAAALGLTYGRYVARGLDKECL